MPGTGWSGVAKGYRDAQGSLQSGETFVTMAYDGRGRRISKTVNTGGTFLDCAYHYYLDGDSMIEVRNGSDQVLKQQVWGMKYVDELVQTSINSDPAADGTCETAYWVCQDANYNVLGIVDSAGTMKERYEYTPYGQRMVYFSPGVNDTDLMAPTLMSRRVPYTGGVNQPYGLCEFGHQGLHHDEELDLIYNRARALHPTLGRFMQRDPLGYVDGMSVYTYIRSSPTGFVDPFGLWKRVGEAGHVWEAEKGDTLSSLASKNEYGGKAANYACLWPIDETNDHGYPNKIHTCDKYDASNLAALSVEANTLSLSISSDQIGLGGALVANGNDVNDQIRQKSLEGGSPITLFILQGHYGGGEMGGSYVLTTTQSTTQPARWQWQPAIPPFSVALFNKVPDPQPTFVRAKARKGPKRCWFARDGEAWFAGCKTTSLAEPFARSALRVGAKAYGTEAYVGVGKGGITWGNYKMENGRPVWDGSTQTSANWQDPAAWKTFPGGL